MSLGNAFEADMTCAKVLIKALSNNAFVGLEHGTLAAISGPGKVKIASQAFLSDAVLFRLALGCFAMKSTVQWRSPMWLETTLWSRRRTTVICRFYSSGIIMLSSV